MSKSSTNKINSTSPTKNSDKSNQKTTIDTKELSEDWLTKKAIEEIQRETVIASIRADKIGATGWSPCALNKTNKRFLTNTIKQTVSHNQRANQKIQVAKQNAKYPKKFGDRKFVFKAKVNAVHKKENK